MEIVLVETLLLGDPLYIEAYFVSGADRHTSFFNWNVQNNLKSCQILACCQKKMANIAKEPLNQEVFKKLFGFLTAVSSNTSKMRKLISRQNFVLYLAISKHKTQYFYCQTLEDCFARCWHKLKMSFQAKILCLTLQLWFVLVSSRRDIPYLYNLLGQTPFIRILGEVKIVKLSYIFLRFEFIIQRFDGKRSKQKWKIKCWLLHTKFLMMLIAWLWVLSHCDNAEKGQGRASSLCNDLTTVERFVSNNPDFPTFRFHNSTFWQSFDRSLSYNSTFWQSFDNIVEINSNSKRKRNILVLVLPQM